MKRSKSLQIILAVICIIVTICLSVGWELSGSFKSNFEWRSNEYGKWIVYSDGSYPTSQWKKIKNEWFYFDENGYAATGWKSIEGFWYYFDSDGSRVANEWKEIDKSWYYFDNEGRMAKDTNIGKYYVGSSGARITNGWIGRKYYNSDGLYDKKVSEDALTNFFEPTFFTKIDDTYFVVDSQSCRLLCSKDISLTPAKWTVIDDDLYYPHTVASDGNVLILDDTYNARWKIYKKDSQSNWKLNQIITLDKDSRPHYTFYDNKNNCFYSLESTNDEIYVLRNTSNGVIISKKVYIPDIGGYTRSFYVNDEYMYIASELPGKTIVVVDYKQGFKIIEKIPVASQYSGMNGLFHYGNYWYATITRNANGDISPELVMVEKLDDFSDEKKVKVLTSTLNIKGIPYFFNENSGIVYLTVIEALGFNKYQENSILKLTFDKQGEILSSQNIYYKWGHTKTNN